MKESKRAAALLAALLMTLPALASCGEDTAEETTADTSVSETQTTETEPQWQYPEADFEGASYRIYNQDNFYNMYLTMNTEELNGDILNDAVYNRNRGVEEALNCVITELLHVAPDCNYTPMFTTARGSVLGGSDDYEVMYLPVSEQISLVTDGILQDLYEVPHLQLNETWWDNQVNTTNTLNGKLYFASGSANLMAFDGMWCLFFNENLMEEYQLEKPYDLVREGKWTLDALIEYGSAFANLNGESTYAYTVGSTNQWGVALHSAYSGAPAKFIHGAGVETLTEDFQLNIENDHFYSVMDKLAILMNQDSGIALKAGTDDFNVEQGGYIYIFNSRRSLFLTAEIKTAQVLREMEDTFGIVPFPKYDEAQDEYRTTLVSQLFYLTVPVTNTRHDLIGTVSECLAYKGYADIVPVYYDSVVKHKGLRNEDSAEMLEILRRTRGVDPAFIYGWNRDLLSAITDKLYTGSSQVASDVASQKPVIESKIEEFMAFFGE